MLLHVDREASVMADHNRLGREPFFHRGLSGSACLQLMSAVGAKRTTPARLVLAFKSVEPARHAEAAGRLGWDAGKSPGEQAWMVGGGPRLQGVMNRSFPQAPSSPSAQRGVAATAYCGSNPAYVRLCRRTANRSSCPSASSRARQSFPTDLHRSG